MDKMEHQDQFKELLTTVLETEDLDTNFLVDVLKVTESDLDYLSTAEEKNISREQNFAELVAHQRELNELYKDKSSLEEAVTSFQTGKESKSVRERMRKISVEVKMLMKGLKHPKQVLDLLGKNTAIHTFYDIDTSRLKARVKSFHYDRINLDFMGFIAEFDNPTLLLDRLNKLKVNISPFNIGAQKEKAAPFLKLICQIPEEHFQKAVDDLNQFGWLKSCDIIHDDDQDLHIDFITRLRVLKKGGLTDEEKESLKRLHDDSVICRGISNSYGLEAVLDNKEYLKNLHTVISEEAVASHGGNLSRDIIDKAKMLEENGMLAKLSVIFSSGISFSTKSKHRYGSSTQTVMDNIILKDESSDWATNIDLLNLIELTYRNLTNKDFILMRSYLGIFTIENSDLVEEALALFQITKKKIEELPLKHKRRMYKFLTSNIGYRESVPNNFAQIWKYWLPKYDSDVFDGREKIINIMVGIIESDGDLNKSQLELAIKQNERIFNDTVRDVVPPIDIREPKLSRIGEQSISILPIDTISIDRNHVVDQTMDIIQLTESQIRIQLFLTQHAWSSALKVLKDDRDDPKVHDSSISYCSKTITEALAYKPKDGLTISVASDLSIRAMAGLVDIHVDLSKIDKDTYIQEINSALSYLAGLDLEESLIAPIDKKSDEVLIKELYKLNTKKSTPPADVQFERISVIDGYETFTIPERHKALKEEYGSYVTTHRIYDGDAILSILMAGGMFSSHQRYRRGMLVDGLSTADDFQRGGANSVFTRTFGENSPIKENFMDGAHIVFDPKIWDRLDFYLYRSDLFGDTIDHLFEQRVSPEDYLSMLKSGAFSKNNEQMFRRGIPTAMFKAIVVEDPKQKVKIISQLTDVGITSINGQSLDDFISVSTYAGYAKLDIIDMGEGLPIGTTKKRKIWEKIVARKKWFYDKHGLEVPLATEIDGKDVHQFDVLLTQDLNTTQIISILSESDAFLKNQFESSALNKLHNTTEEQAILIGKQFDKYFYKKTNQDIFTDQEIRVGLSLGNIGFNLGYLEAVLPDDVQLFTKGIAQDVLEKIGFPQDKISLMIEILTLKVMKECLESGGTDEVMQKTVKTIVGIAEQHGVPVSSVFELLKMVYICDASSYTRDATGYVDSYWDIIGLFNHDIPGEIQLNIELKTTLNRLEARLNSDFYYKAISKYS